MCSAFHTGGVRKREPEVVAGRRHQEQHQQRREAEHLEREADELAVVAPASVSSAGEVAAGCPAPRYHSSISHDMRQRDQERQHAEMPAVVEQRQEAAVEPRQRPDATG